MKKDDGTIHSFFGPESELTGKLKFEEGQTVLGGSFEGEVETNSTLIINDSGRVKGTFRVGSIVIRGELEGDVYAEESIVVEKPATVKGSLTSKSLTIEPGVVFDGSCNMTTPNNQFDEFS